MDGFYGPTMRGLEGTGTNDIFPFLSHLFSLLRVTDMLLNDVKSTA
jgi:hypothetical protein